MRRGGPNEILLAYVFMALATLTKGLIGVVLPGLIVFAFVAVRRERWVIRAVKPIAGLVVFFNCGAVVLLGKPRHRRPVAE